MRRRLVLGAALWLLRPVYVVLELVVAAAATSEYSLIADPVSTLGAVACMPDLCSPRHELMNGTFTGVGLLLALGAALLATRLRPVVTGLLVIAGLSSVATGLTPVDQHPTLHALVAAPLFVCQPLALLALAWQLRWTHFRLAGVLLVTGLVTAAATVGFVIGDTGAGLLERLALWPVLVVFGAVAAVVVRPAAAPAVGSP